jgi:hypothetical protein
MIEREQTPLVHRKCTSENQMKVQHSKNSSKEEKMTTQKQPSTTSTATETT